MIIFSARLEAPLARLMGFVIPPDPPFLVERIGAAELLMPSILAQISDVIQLRFIRVAYDDLIAWDL